MQRPIKWMMRVLRTYLRVRGRQKPDHSSLVNGIKPEADQLLKTSGTYTAKHDYDWARSELKKLSNLDIYVWRSVNTSFLRAFVHRRFFGRGLLRILYWCEERAPRFFGRIGQYPMITFGKPATKKDVDL
jgi:hypothetical protein